MQVKKVNDEFSVSPQIEIADLDVLVEQGYKSLLCNRPDDESPDQRAFEEIASGARQRGLAVQWVPVVSGKITEQDMKSFATTFEALPKPLLAYCRTGTRSITLWAMDQGRKGVSAERILALGASAGYDLSDTVRGFLQK